ncbi:MAG: stage II sporulation protein D [Ruminococcaceae bacterium]|nr:stage II sporulation protein D [Oscillospiraceae bacterium]
MKTVYVTIMMVTAMFMLLLPITAGAKTETKVEGLLASGENITEEEKLSKVKVLMSDTKEITEFSLEDYLFGVVAAEMPALYEEDALKAQTVAAYTYFLRKKESNAQQDYDITDDYTVDQAFVTPEEARKKWSDSAETYERKIRNAVLDVMYKKLTYDSKLAATVYHAISFGVTENASEVWGGQYPYLVSVDSSFDKLADNYLSTVNLTSEELKTALSGKAEVKSLTENCVSDIKRTKAGSVKSVSISGVSVSGSDIRKALELRSSDFDVSFADGVYTFTVRGYGHFIGMSQNGANYMAKQGKNWQEILLHYYPGCKIE